MKMLPDLKIQSALFPKNSLRRDLQCFLFLGGASLNTRWERDKIKLCELRLERVELLMAIKEEIETSLILGKSINSVYTLLSSVRFFIQFIDKNNLTCSLEELISNYLEYSEYLFQEVYKKSPRIKLSTANGYATNLSALFGKILEISDYTKLCSRTRLKPPKVGRRSLSKKAEKQNLEKTFELGNFLVDFIEGITKESILGKLPLNIQRRQLGNENNHIQLGCSADEWLAKPKEEWTKTQKSSISQTLKIRQPVQSIEGTSRWKIVNLYIAATFLVFIAQTGMNKTQAQDLKRDRFKYESSGEYWIVRTYKNRRGGEVVFKIYKSYKPSFLKYLFFINYFFPNSKWLFPVVGKNGKDYITKRVDRYKGIKSVLKSNGIPWIPPILLRNTRVNWILRRSGDEDITAEMAQHSKEVLRDKYELPSQQRAMIEITRFWNKHDPIVKGDLKGSVISGFCNGKPETSDNKPSLVVAPNCVNSSGCLWCKHLRDVDSEDYVWSLVSMRYLKSIEASVSVTVDEIPADTVINRLTEKIGWFKNSSKKRVTWVEEAKQRIEEGWYHPNWSNIIEFLE